MKAGKDSELARHSISHGVGVGVGQGFEGRLRTVGGTTLALAVIAVVVADDEGIGIDLVLDGSAEAVSGETHIGWIWRCFW